MDFRTALDLTNQRGSNLHMETDRFTVRKPIGFSIRRVRCDGIVQVWWMGHVVRLALLLGCT